MQNVHEKYTRMMFRVKREDVSMETLGETIRETFQKMMKL